MPTVTNAPTPPPSPLDGDLWFNTITGREYVWYIPPSGVAVWVQTQPSGSAYVAPDPQSPIIQPPTASPADITRTPTLTISAVAPLSPLDADLWWSPVTGQQYVWYNDGNTRQWVISNWGAGRRGEPGPAGVVRAVLPGDDIDVSTDPYEPVVSVTPGAFDRPTDTIDWSRIVNEPATFPPTLPIAQSDVTNLVGDLALKAPLASPALTGNPTAPTPSTADNDTSIATTAYVKSNIGALNIGDYQLRAEKGQASGYASLDVSGKVPSLQLPAYVDDVLEFANLAAFPVTGSVGIIYIALDTNRTYRWSGSTYTEISPSPGSTDSVPEGSVNLYYTDARAQAANAAALALKAPLASPALTGNPTAPTPTAGDNDTSIATTAFVQAALGFFLPLAGGTLTGDLRVSSSTTVAMPIFLGEFTNPAFNVFSLNGSASNPAGFVGGGNSVSVYPYLPTGGSWLYRWNGVDRYFWSEAALGPTVDNSRTLGDATHRWNKVWATDADFSGTVTAPTPTPANDSSTKVATTAFVMNALASGASISVGVAPPGSPAPNQMWWNSETGVLFLYYNDGSTTQWVPAAPPGSMAQGPRLLARITTTAGQSSAYFPNLPSDINDLEVRFSAIPTAGGSQFYLALLDAAGATIGSAYNWQGSYANSASAAGTAAPMISNVSAGGGYNTAFYMTANVDVSTATGIIGRATLNNIRSTVTRKNCEWSALFNNSANTAAYTFSIHGYNSTTAPISGVILAFNLTTFAAGSVVSLYGSP